MPTFPDGSRVWLTDSTGQVTLKEYGEHVEVNEALKTHTRTVYIAAVKGQEFEVCTEISKSRSACKLEVWLDGSRATKNHAHRGTPLTIKGWRLDSHMLQRFSFGGIDISETQAGQRAVEDRKLDKATIEVKFFDADITDILMKRGNAARKVRIAGPVHPDSKIASLLGMQLKGGSIIKDSSPKQPKSNVLTTSVRLKQKVGAITYIARFAYRTREHLVAEGIMPKAELSAQAGPSVIKKRKRKDSAPSHAVGKAARGLETAEQRKKRLTAQMQAFKREFGEEAALSALRSSSDDDDDIVEVKSPVKKERKGGESSSTAIDVDAKPRKQRITVDLSED